MLLASLAALLISLSTSRYHELQQTLPLLANQISIALANSRLYEQEQRRANQLAQSNADLRQAQAALSESAERIKREAAHAEALVRIAGGLNVQLDLSTVMSAVCEETGRALELRDHETQGHTRRVPTMTVRLGRLLGVLEEDLVHLRRALDIPYSHHEKWDGAGYLLCLKVEEIPLWARIFAIVDVWDALRSNRPCHRSWKDDEVRA